MHPFLKHGKNSSTVFDWIKGWTGQTKMLILSLFAHLHIVLKSVWLTFLFERQKKKTELSEISPVCSSNNANVQLKHKHCPMFTYEQKLKLNLFMKHMSLFRRLGLNLLIHREYAYDLFHIWNCQILVEWTLVEFFLKAYSPFTLLNHQKATHSPMQQTCLLH